MFSRSMLSLAVGGLLVASAALAGPIFTGPATTSSLGQPLTFNLIGGGDLGSLDDLPGDPNDYVLQVISTVWSFDPPPGETGFLDLGGTLEIGGIDSGLSFAETIDMSDETGSVVFSTNDGGSGGLPFSAALAAQLLAGNGTLSGVVVPAAGTEDEWQAFFDTGSTLTNYVFFELTFKDTNVVPEPTTVLVWGCVGALGLAAHRWQRRRRSA